MTLPVRSRTLRYSLPAPLSSLIPVSFSASNFAFSSPNTAARSALTAPIWLSICFFCLRSASLSLCSSAWALCFAFSRYPIRSPFSSSVALGRKLFAFASKIASFSVTTLPNSFWTSSKLPRSFKSDSISSENCFKAEYRFFSSEEYAPGSFLSIL